MELGEVKLAVIYCSRVVKNIKVRTVFDFSQVLHSKLPILVVLFQHRQKIQPMNYLLYGHYPHRNYYSMMMAFYHGVNNKPKTYPGLIFCHNTSFLNLCGSWILLSAGAVNTPGKN